MYASVVTEVNIEMTTIIKVVIRASATNRSGFRHLLLDIFIADPGEGGYQFRLTFSQNTNI